MELLQALSLSAVSGLGQVIWLILIPFPHRCRTEEKMKFTDEQVLTLNTCPLIWNCLRSSFFSPSSPKGTWYVFSRTTLIDTLWFKIKRCSYFFSAVELSPLTPQPPQVGPSFPIILDDGSLFIPLSLPLWILKIDHSWYWLAHLLASLLDVICLPHQIASFLLKTEDTFPSLVFIQNQGSAWHIPGPKDTRRTNCCCSYNDQCLAFNVWKLVCF